MSANRSAFLQVEEEDGRTTVRLPAGTILSESNSEEFARELLALAEPKERPHLTVDLGGVVMLTSVILGKFLAINGHVRDRGGRFTLFNVNSNVYEVFVKSRLDTILEVHAIANPLPA